MKYHLVLRSFHPQIKEVVSLVSSRTPTHQVTHRAGWSYGLHIYPVVQEGLASPDRSLRQINALTSVAAAFRDVCQRNVEGFNLRFVEWFDIVEVRLLTPREQAYYESLRRPMDRDGESCDDCDTCRNGQHAVCEGGYCVQAYA